jgi:hypothetical protein
MFGITAHRRCAALLRALLLSLLLAPVAVHAHGFLFKPPPRSLLSRWYDSPSTAVSGFPQAHCCWSVHAALQAEQAGALDSGDNHRPRPVPTCRSTCPTSCAEAANTLSA